MRSAGRLLHCCCKPATGVIMGSPSAKLGRTGESPRSLVILFTILIAGGIISTYWNNPFVLVVLKKLTPFKGDVLFDCMFQNSQESCSVNEYPIYNHTKQTMDPKNGESCPLYFRWIYDDLRPWTDTGITEDMVEHAKPYAHFRLIISNGRAYVEQYRKSSQTRDVFTIWGILQLLRRYPGQLRDLDIMFNCYDKPSIAKGDGYANNPIQPPLFGYCVRDGALAIVFPDWSFWGWPEFNIKPWKPLLKELKEQNEKIKWMDREPYAFWKGTPHIYRRRKDLLKCNVSKAKDWNARVYALDWHAEYRNGFKNSNLTSQCNYRYRIYVEGNAWSVSQKYILACDSMTLLLEPQYYDFFSRGLLPMKHYWPVRAEDNDCDSIKFAVDWGNRHKQQAQLIGRAASTFIQEEVKMDYVYDYMLHLLNEYAKLLRYKPKIPPRAKEVCVKSIDCCARGRQKKFMLESMVKGPSHSRPCYLLEE